MRLLPALHERLVRAPPGDHVAQLFNSPERLAVTVAQFSQEGLTRGQGVILILTPSNYPTVRRKLQEFGLAADELEAEGHLIFADAKRLLTSLTRDGLPAPTEFRSLIGELIDRCREREPRREVRIYGEIVQILQQQRQVEFALRLEELWEELVRERGVALLCGYSPSGPDGEPFPAVLAAPHAHVFRELSARERLLEAGEKLFARGYEDATTAAIARRAGSSESQIVKHFGTKEGLLRAILEQWWQRVLEGIDEVAIARLPPLEALGQILSHMLEAFRQDEGMARVLLFEGRRMRRGNSGVILSRGFVRFAQMLEGIFERAARQGQLASGFTPQTARDTLLGASEGLVRSRLMASLTDYPATYDAEDLRTALHALTGALLRA